MVRRSLRWAPIIATALLLWGARPSALASSPEGGPPNDVRVVPSAERFTLAALSDGSGAPGYYETSQFMMGKVAVGVILPESAGSQENWTAAEEQKVLSEILSATRWWAAREPKARLQFQLEMRTKVPVSVEPIALSSSYEDESKWVKQAMTYLGFPGTSTFQQAYAYNNDLRTRLNADWAFTIFVVDSSNDPDGKFSDGYFAYAYLGGPYMVMTYKNNGYDPDNMEAVAAHEIGHIFWALDQYREAGQPCDLISGYLGIENQNSDYGGCRLRQKSIMKEVLSSYAEGAVDPFARGQLSWQDSDGDGILDPVDTQPSVSLSQTPEQVDGKCRYKGLAKDLPFPGAKMRGITINKIAEVSFRLSDGVWVQAVADDGSFDSPQESFHFDLPETPPNLSVRATNSVGNKAYSLAFTANATYQAYIPLVIR